MADQRVVLELSRAEAIVLFEWLARFSQSGTTEVQDQSEERVLFDLEAQLESILDEPFRTDYEQIVASARSAVRGSV